MSPKENTQDYTAKQITVLAGLEPVRKRPGMYIGGTGLEGLHHLIWEVVDNAVDEAMAGFCGQIEVRFMLDDKVSVEDNGRGIPVDTHAQTKKSALETVLTTLHAGGKFGSDTYKVSGGLHGVGVSVVNALSIWLRAEVYRDGKIYVQEYSQGKPSGPVKVEGETTKTGTKIIFRPDGKIFEKTEFNLETVLEHLRQQAFLTKGIEIYIYDERNPQKVRSHGFCFEGGLSSFLQQLNVDREALNDPPFHTDNEFEGVQVEVALQYTDDFNEHLFTFANNINTKEGGTHLTGFRSALTRVINDYAKKNDFIKGADQTISGEDTREGLTAAILVRLKDPQFEGQTKSRLGNPEVRKAVDAVMAERFAYYLDEHPSQARSIIEKCFLSSRARLAAKAARETVIRKGVLEGMTLPGKLSDCSSRDPHHSELYIVEGDSAGGSAKQGRDRTFQAILPLRGKILNVERVRLDKMLASDEIKALIIAIGCGVGEQIDYSKLRYDKIVIMTDADVDGSHIRTLLLTFFFRHFRQLIDDGHLYIAQPPLYAISHGKSKSYVYSEEEKKAKLKTIDGKASLQRYKGLGEMNPIQLWDTTMDPKNRVFLQVTVDEAERADKTFTMLMGREVPPRKKFIQTHARTVKNLDI